MFIPNPREQAGSEESWSKDQAEHHQRRSPESGDVFGSKISHFVDFDEDVGSLVVKVWKLRTTDRKAGSLNPRSTKLELLASKQDL